MSNRPHLTFEKGITEDEKVQLRQKFNSYFPNLSGFFNVGVAKRLS